jgi:surface carbohydrate biosynthesis protein (TIGR04326 family)
MYDVALTSISSSAAVDAYLAGKFVISVRDPDNFNMSPLRGFVGVEFVSSAAELLKALKLTNSADSDRAQDYFYTDPSLHYWSSLLGCRPLRLECGNV